MADPLIKQVRSMKALGRAWNVIHTNGRSSHSRETTREIEEFSRSAVPRLTTIQRQLAKNAFKFAPSIGVAMEKKDKKSIRPLVIAPIESRVVQRAILDVLLTVPTILRIAENPYSFGGVRKQPGNDLAAVPAAIEAVLKTINERRVGYVIRSDIAAFFTRIPKTTATSIVGDAINDPAFLTLFSQAIAVELENLGLLRQHASAFPIAELGVAQGCSLSPLLGNMILGKFDADMNSGACRCIRYIDDFIILAPDRNSGEAHFARARRHLATLGMETSPDKTKRGELARGFQFLGVELCNGAIKPTRESRRRLLQSVEESFDESASAFRLFRKTGLLDRRLTLTRTLYEVSAIVYGWGRHYKFCNERNIFSQLDAELNELLRRYIGAYRAECLSASHTTKRHLLGIPLLQELIDAPFDWPKSPSVPLIPPLSEIMPSPVVTSL